MDKQEFIKKVHELINEKNIIDFTLSLCSIKTVNPPGNEYLCRESLNGMFKLIGADKVNEYEKEKGRTNYVAVKRGCGKGESYKKIAVIGHMDVVPVEGQDWETDPFHPEIIDGKIHARGVLDNKGPFVAALEGFRLFNEIVGNKYSGEVIFVAAADEETGSESGIKYLLDNKYFSCDCALIPDSEVFSKAVYGEMGIYLVKIRSKGLSAHGSLPEKGRNAIVPLAHLLELLHEYKWENLIGTHDFDHVVLNIGRFAGGSAPNIVPDSAYMNAMWRYPVGIKIEEINVRLDELIRNVKEKYSDAEIEYELLHQSIPMIGDKNSELFNSAITSAKDLGLGEVKLSTVRGETVAKYIKQKTGAEVLVNGPSTLSNSLCHMPNENVAIEDLVNFAKYYALLFFKLHFQD